MPDNFTNLIFASGKKGFGKSTLLRALIAHNARKPGALFVVWDSTREYQESRSVVVLRPPKYSARDAAEYALSRKPCVLVMDEVDRAAPNHKGGLREGTPLHTIVHYGRHEDVALWCAARRSANVHIDIRALADIMFLFRHSEPRDIEWIEKLCGNEVATRIKSLPRGRHIRVNL